MNCLAVTGGNFESEVLESAVPVLVDFWAPWCGPCKTIGPALEQIANEYSGRLKVCKINIDEEGALAEKHGITSIPTLILYKNAQAAAQKNGAAPKHEIEAFFKSYL
ncbi:MAG: thioredoxin [Treponema sp.]|nr:thioredoxin [Treponema sp.]